MSALRRWYFPSWHGDLRLTRAEVPEETLLTIEKPTADEQRVLNKIGAELVERGWLAAWTVEAPKKRFFGQSKREIRVLAPLEKVGPVVAAILRPGPATLTAIRLSNGQVELSSAGELEKGEALPAATETLPPALPAPEKPEKKAKPEVAVTVKRATPSCPACVPGSVGPASEVLLEFLDPEQHDDWKRTRSIVAYGGYTGRPYLLAHRHTPRAVAQGRICMDLSLGAVIHFHDWSVPPEEEVLAAKLILEHREDWLRNEATALSTDVEVFKNPFGNMSDGVEDALFTERVGAFAQGFVKGFDQGFDQGRKGPVRYVLPGGEYVDC